LELRQRLLSKANELLQIVTEVPNFEHADDYFRRKHERVKEEKRTILSKIANKEDEERVLLFRIG